MSTVDGSQPRSRAICQRVARRSIEPTSSFTSAMSVLSSITNSARRPGASEDVDHATFAEDRVGHLRSEDPIGQLRSEPPSDGLMESGMARRQQAVEVTGSPTRGKSDSISSTRAIRSSVPMLIDSRWPRSITEMTERSTLARIARSIWRQPRLIRTARKVAPSRCIGSIDASLRRSAQPAVIRPLVAHDHELRGSGQPNDAEPRRPTAAAVAHVPYSGC